MRHALAAILTAAISTAALSTVAIAQDQAAGQASAWQTFEDGSRSGALLSAADGSQIVIKCDKPGRREVHAMILAGEDKLAVPNDRPISRSIRFQFDDKAPSTENWRFYEKYAMASGKTGDRALAHFIVDLRNATKVRAILDTGIASPIEKNFDVAGAKEAIAHVYEACRDTPPA